jgi:hypothetical protein
MGRRCSGIIMDRIVMEPENRPAVPMPEMARPTMKATELGATPLMRLPTSKMNMAVRYVYLTLKCL